LLVGDPTDNIKGASGIGKVKASRILEGITDESALYDAVRGHYSSMEELEMNARCLWIHRKEDDDVTERWKDWVTD
jgi:5'-3' exonuclease